MKRDPQAVQREREMRCREKKAFATQEEAANLTGLQPYLCSICGKWHRTTGMAGRIGKQLKAGKSAMYHQEVKPSRLKQRRKRFTKRKRHEHEGEG